MLPIDPVPLVSAQLEKISYFKNRVFGIEELQEAITQPLAKLKVPCAYVILLSDDAGPDDNITIPTQKVTVAYGIVTAIANTTNPLGILGGGTKANMQTVRADIIGNQLGFELHAEMYPPIYRKGRLVQLTDGVLWWQFDFVTAQHIRSEQ